MEIEVTGLSQMQHGDSKIFTFEFEGSRRDGFLIKSKDSYFAYLNQCAHWPSPLDMGDGDFYYSDLDRIVCKTHGASFMLEDGYCDDGPCEGGRLKSFPVRTEGGKAFIKIEMDT